MTLYKVAAFEGADQFLQLVAQVGAALRPGTVMGFRKAVPLCGAASAYCLHARSAWRVRLCAGPYLAAAHALRGRLASRLRCAFPSCRHGASSNAEEPWTRRRRRASCCRCARVGGLPACPRSTCALRRDPCAAPTKARGNAPARQRLRPRTPSAPLLCHRRSHRPCAVGWSVLQSTRCPPGAPSPLPARAAGLERRPRPLLHAAAQARLRGGGFCAAGGVLGRRLRR